MDENIENMPSSLDSLSRLEDKGQNLNYKQLRPTSRRKFKEKNQYFISLMWFKDCFVLIYFIDNSTMQILENNFDQGKDEDGVHHNRLN